MKIHKNFVIFLKIIEKTILKFSQAKALENFNKNNFQKISHKKHEMFMNFHKFSKNPRNF